MFSAVNLFTSLAFYGAQSFYKSTTSTVQKTIPPFAPSYLFYFSEIVFVDSGSGGFFDADSLAEGCDEREESDLEHNF